MRATNPVRGGPAVCSMTDLRPAPAAVRVAIAVIAACWLVQPAVAVARPRATMMWENIDPATATSQVNSHTIYLHRCVGSDCTVAQGTTNSTTSPVHSSLGHGVLSPF